MALAFSHSRARLETCVNMEFAEGCLVDIYELHVAMFDEDEITACWRSGLAAVQWPFGMQRDVYV